MRPLCTVGKRGNVAGKFGLWMMLQKLQPNCYASQQSRPAPGEQLASGSHQQLVLLRVSCSKETDEV